MNARDYALLLIDRLHLPGRRSKLLRRKLDPPADLRDLGLAEQIHAGVLKNQALLNHLIDHYAEHPGRIDPLVREILAIGLYQLRFLQRIPASAAVDEAVEQARRFGRPNSAGFVNAILRRASREPDVPVPERAGDPCKYATIALSHPRELFDRLVALLGVEDALRFCEHDNAEPPTLVRTFADVSPDQLAVAGVTIAPHEQSGIHVVEGARRPTLADWSLRGLAQVQDATAARVIEYLDIEPNHRVLDRCAGLGTKTVQIQERLSGDRGAVMAIDPSEPRGSRLREVVAARKFGNVAVVRASWLREMVDLRRPAFDRVLLDVPCSNSGVLARRPEARYIQTADALESLIKLQDQIMDDTAGYLLPGGLMVYSTCSVWPEENDQRIQRFLKSRADYELLDTQSTLPSFENDPARYHDGGFVAVLRRR